MAYYSALTREFAPLEEIGSEACTKGCSTKITFRNSPQGRPAAVVVRDGRSVVMTRQPIAITSMAFCRGGAQVAGRLWEPVTPGPHPAVLLIGGTGKNSRDDFRIYPYLFVKAGYAVYAVDSVGDEEGITALARFNLAAVQALRQLPRIDPDRIGVLGISHGSWVALEAAHEDRRIAFVIPVVGGGVPLWRATLFEAHRKQLAKGHDAAAVSAGDALMAGSFDALRRGRANLVPALIKAAAAQPWFTDTPLAPFAGLPDEQLVAIARQRWADELSYDPAPVLSKLDIPIFAISSEKDEYVPGAENLAAIKTATSGRADTLLLRGANHWQSLADSPEFTYAAVLEPALVAWLTDRRETLRHALPTVKAGAKVPPPSRRAPAGTGQ
jgi:pimeloyl-ACP methyl ester carboxylesterase